MTDLVAAPTFTSHAAASPGDSLRRGVAVYAVIGLCHLPLLLVQWWRLWQIEWYRYFPFLLAAVALLWLVRWRQLLVRPAYVPTRSSLAVLLLGWLVLLTATIVASPWLGTVAALVSALSLLLAFGRSATASLVPPWALLWLTLPLPFRWDQRLFVWLQGWVCAGGSRLLDFAGFNHVLAGYALDVPGRHFQVEELSGGAQCILALIAMAAVLAIWLRRGWLHGPLLVCAGAFWAVALPMLGAALMVVLAVDQGVEVTGGTARYLFEAGFIGSALLVLLSTDRLILFFTVPSGFRPAEYEDDTLDDDESDEDSDVSVAALGGNIAVRLASRTARIGERFLVVAFLAVGVLQIGTWIGRAREPGKASTVAGTSSEGGLESWTAALGADTLPAALGGWQTVDFQTVTRAPDSDLGRHSLVWRYADARDEAIISLDFPFIGWHHSARSFEERGWEIESRQVLAPDSPTGPVLEVRMRDASGRRGYLLVNQRTQAGQTLTPPPSAGWSLSAWLANARVRLLSRFGEEDDQPAIYKIQLLVMGDLPLDAARQAQAQEVFQSVVARICERAWAQEAAP